MQQGHVGAFGLYGDLTFTSWWDKSMSRVRVSDTEGPSQQRNTNSLYFKTLNYPSGLLKLCDDHNNEIMTATMVLGTTQLEPSSNCAGLGFSWVLTWNLCESVLLVQSDKSQRRRETQSPLSSDWLTDRQKLNKNVTLHGYDLWFCGFVLCYCILTSYLLLCIV